MNHLDLDTLKYDPMSVKVGDRFRMNDREYAVTKITYNSGYDTLGTIRFECEGLLSWPPLANEVYTPYNNNIRFETLWPNPFIRQQQEEEISNETREEFMRLLK